MAFNNLAIFPTDVSVGTSGGPGFSTSIVEGDSGSSERVSRWAGARHKYNAKYGIRTRQQLNKVMDLYVVSQGPVVGFRYKDWMDFTTAADHISPHTNVDCVTALTNGSPGIATGSSGLFQLRTQYVFGGTTVYRNITKPITGTVLVARTPSGGGSAVNISTFSLDNATGIINISSGLTTGDTITAGCEFDVPCQFGAELDDVLATSIENFNIGDLPDIPIVEMMGDSTSPERFYYGGGSVVTTAANFFINFGMGRVIAYTPSSTATNVTAFLPDPTDLELGGPYFHIINGNLGGGDLTLKTFDGATTVANLGGPGNCTILCVYNDGTTNRWLSFNNF